MTKKDKILKMFNSIEWMEGVKIIGYEDYRKAGLGATIEYQEKYCDVIYSKMIFKKMGYRVIQGTYSVFVHNENSRYPPK